MKSAAIYLRVSTNAQDTASQEPDLQTWATGQTRPVLWFVDKASGKSMDRPALKQLEAAVQQGQIDTIVCWRIDRLGRTGRGLTALFDDLQQRKVNLISLRDGMDLSTPAGRLMAHILASAAQYENEIRSERVRAGIAAARAKGKRWGGCKKGTRKQISDAQVRMIRRLKSDGESVTAIAEAARTTRATVYAVLRRA